MGLRIIFMGTPEFSVLILESLIKKYDVVAIVTKSDKEIGRKKEISFSPIKKVAIKNNIPVLQPEKIGEIVNEIKDYHPDMIITCAYGQFVPASILDIPKYGSVNVHASLLPKLRGGAPIHKAIINGYSKTGITIMRMIKKMDAGDIISFRETKISEFDDAGLLHDRLQIIGRDLLLETIPNIVSGKYITISQNEEEATFAYNITRSEEYLDFSKSKKEVMNQIRGLYPWPTAYTNLFGKETKVLKAKIAQEKISSGVLGEIIAVYPDSIGVRVKDGMVLLEEIKIDGKKRMLVKDYLNGIKKEELMGVVLE